MFTFIRYNRLIRKTYPRLYKSDKGQNSIIRRIIQLCKSQMSESERFLRKAP